MHRVGRIEGSGLVNSVAVGQVHTRRQRLVGDDAGKIRLGLIFRKHALQLGAFVSEIVDKQRSAPGVTKFYSGAHVYEVVARQLSVRAGELVRV